MIRIIVWTVPVALLAAVALAMHDRPSVSVAALVLGTVYAMVSCLRLELRRWPVSVSLSPTGGTRRPPAPSTVPADVRLTRELSFAFRSRQEYDAALRPALYRAARGRLWELGASVDDQRQVEALLGSEVWNLIAPPRRGELRRGQPAPSAAAIEQAIERIETS